MKAPSESHEQFFLRYQLAKTQCEVHNVHMGPEEAMGRHLFHALGYNPEQIARVLEKRDWKYPPAEADVLSIIEGLQRKVCLSKEEIELFSDQPHEICHLCTEHLAIG